MQRFEKVVGIDLRVARHGRNPSKFNQRTFKFPRFRVDSVVLVGFALTYRSNLNITNIVVQFAGRYELSLVARAE